MTKKESYLVKVGDPRPAGGGLPATGPEYRAKIAAQGPPTMPGITSLYEMFTASVEKVPNNRCLGRRVGDEFQWMSYKETAAAAAAIGSAMADVGLKPHDRVGIYGVNCPEWMIAMQGCNRMNLYCIPLYDSLGENAIEFIINHSEASIVFSQFDKLKELGKALPKVNSLVKTVVYWGNGDVKVVEDTKSKGVAVYSFEDFMALGKSKPKDASPPKPEDLCTIMYTSGTTGDPKGVELSHRAVLDVIFSMQEFTKSINDIGIAEDDVFLSYLPLAHIFDRASEELFLFAGGSIGYWRGDIKGLVDDIAVLKPTLFAGVPRVFDRIYHGVMTAVDGGSFLKKALFHWGFNRKLHNLRNGHRFDHAAPFFDKLVFSKVKARLGGNVKLIVSGGAPLAPHVEDFLRVTMCARVVQGYGLTETCAASFIAHPDEPDHFNTVGPPQPVLSFRLEAVQEMNYDPMGTPARGEVCVKGPAVFTGYYKDEEKTKEVLDADGWFHTGDVGELSDTGALKIIDRKKNIFKLAQGEYIAVEKIEGVYKKNNCVEQIWVYGNSYKPSLVAVVVPTSPRLQSIAHSVGASGSDEELCGNAAVREAFLKDLNATAKEAKLKGFEMVRAVALTMDMFSVENDLLTPSFKLKRPQLQKCYQAEIDAMYAAMPNK